MTLGELMPDFGTFHCMQTTGIDGSAVYAGKTYFIAIDKERGRALIHNDGVYLFATLEELQEIGTIE